MSSVFYNFFRKILGKLILILERESVFIGTVLYGTVRYCTVTFFFQVVSVVIPCRFRVVSVECVQIKNGMAFTIPLFHFDALRRGLLAVSLTFVGQSR